MNTQTTKLNEVNTNIKLNHKLMIGCLLALSATSAFADDYQQNMLFSPSEHILVAEARGRVMIYDGLENTTVEKAMDHQFNRIGSMMFVRTQYKQENGEVVEDEDCSD